MSASRRQRAAAPGSAKGEGGKSSGQRQRLIAATIDAVAEEGYAGTTVADIVKRAGVSRATFYELFDDKEACFLAAYSEMIEVLTARVAAAFEEGAPERASWPERVRVALEALLELLAANPQAARVAIVEVIGAGPRAQALALQAIPALVPLVKPGVELIKGSELPPRVPRAVIAGAAMLVVEEINAGRIEGLPELLPDLLYVVLVPFLGHQQARERMLAAQREPSARKTGMASIPPPG